MLLEDKSILTRTVRKYGNGAFFDEVDEVAAEFPLTVHLNGEEWATMVCSPSNLEELVVGFLASEGIIRRFSEITRFSIDQDKGFAYVQIDKLPEDRARNTSKRFIGSCCGKSRQFYFTNDMLTAKTVTANTELTALKAIHHMQELQELSRDFHRTGGMHNAAICSTTGIIQCYQDIGRHNALDKLYGYCLMNHIPVKDKVIAFSGRISSEVLLKISKMGIAILLSKSAPTNLALELADDLGITAVGFIRGDRMNIYTHPERITGTELHM